MTWSARNMEMIGRKRFLREVNGMRLAGDAFLSHFISSLDTMGAIVGSLAGAYYEIPEHIYSEAIDRLPKEMIDIVYTFAEEFQPYYEYRTYIKERFNIDNNN